MKLVRLLTVLGLASSLFAGVVQASNCEKGACEKKESCCKDGKKCEKCEKKCEKK